MSWPIVNQKMFIITVLTLQQKVIFNHFKILNIDQVTHKSVPGLQNYFMQDSESVHPECQHYKLNLLPNKNPFVHTFIIYFMQMFL